MDADSTQKLERNLEKKNTRQSLALSRTKSLAGAESVFQEEELTSTFLCEAAEIETRLRQHIIELMEPTIRKHGILEAKIKECRASIDTRAQEMNELRQVKEHAESKYKLVENFRAELAEWDKERRTHQQEAGERLSHQEKELNALRVLLEQRNSGTVGLDRAIKNVGDLVKTARDETAQLRTYAMEKLDMNRDKVAKLRDEFEQRTSRIEVQIHQLEDRQTCSDKLMQHMSETVATMSTQVRAAEENIADIWRSKASVGNLEEQQQDLTEFMRHVNATVSSLKHQFGSLVDDVKSHFQEAANVVGTTTARQIEAMRQQCNEELHRVDAVAEDIKRFVNQATDQQVGLKAEVTAVRHTARDELEGLKQSVQLMEKSRQVGTNNIGVEMEQMRKSVSDLKAQLQSEVTVSSLRNDIMEILVEGQLLSAHLDMQDDHDRKNIALFGYKSAEARDNKASCSLPDLSHDRVNGGSVSARGPRRRAPSSNTMTSSTSINAAAEAPVLSLDKRCLSCSGSSGTILAGFKLACLTYAPTHIEFEKATYSRSELICQRLDMLKHAKEQLKSRSADV